MNKMEFLTEKPVGKVPYYRVEVEATLRDHTDGYCSDVDDNDNGCVTTRQETHTLYVLAPAQFSCMQWSDHGECTVEFGSGYCKHTNDYKIVRITGVNL
jgi:hypothetical protein